MVWRAGTDPEYRGDPGSGGLDPHDGGPDPVVLDVETFGDRYSIVPRAPGRPPPAARGRHRRVPTPKGSRGGSQRSFRRPGWLRHRYVGGGRGRPAGRVGSLARCEQRSPRDIAYAAHRLEVDILGVESGIQDQLSAAFGGINYLEIETYPEARVYPLPTWEELGPRLTLVFLGRAHDSSAVHRQVIEDVGCRGSAVFSRLRDAAVAARDAVLARDLDAFGQAMIANTEAQGSLHPEIVGVDARRVIEFAAARGAIGWKVNGAGGDGGSVTILSANPEAKEALEHRVTALDEHYRVLPIHVSPVGLEVRGALE